MAELLVRVGSALPWIAVGISLVGGLAGLAYINRGERRQRRDRGAAAVSALALALVAGGITTVFTAMLGSAWGGGNWLAAVPVATTAFGLPVALVVLAASTAGYAALAFLRPGGSAVAGAVLGPVLLGAAGLAAIGLVQAGHDMAVAAARQQEREEVADRSSDLQLTVDDVEATLDDKGLVTAVRVRLSIESDTEFALELLPGKLVYPVFVLRPNGDDPNTEIQADAPPGSPSVLAAGSITHYEIVFDAGAAGTPQLSSPGEWLLIVSMGGADGQPYGLETTITVAG